MGKYFEQLYMNPLSRQLLIAGLKRVNAHPPIDKTPPSLGEVGCGKADGICKINEELLRAWGVAMIYGLHVVYDCSMVIW